MVLADALTGEQVNHITQSAAASVRRALPASPEPIRRTSSRAVATNPPDQGGDQDRLIHRGRDVADPDL
jgi:hypothetical protein